MTSCPNCQSANADESVRCAKCQRQLRFDPVAALDLSAKLFASGVSATQLIQAAEAAKARGPQGRWLTPTELVALVKPSGSVAAAPSPAPVVASPAPAVSPRPATPAAAAPATGPLANWLAEARRLTAAIRDNPNRLLLEGIQKVDAALSQAARGPAKDELAAAFGELAQRYGQMAAAWASTRIAQGLYSDVVSHLDPATHWEGARQCVSDVLAEARCRWAVNLMREKKAAEAGDQLVLASAIEMTQSSSKATFLSAVNSISQATPALEPARMIPLLRKSLALKPDQRETAVNLCRMLMVQARETGAEPEKVLSLASEVLSLDPQNKEAAETQSRLLSDVVRRLLGQDQFAVAADLLRQARRTRPDDASLGDLLVQSLVGLARGKVMSEPEQACVVLAEARSIQPDNSEVLDLLAETEVAQLRSVLANRQWEKAIALAQGNMAGLSQRLKMEASMEMSQSAQQLRGQDEALAVRLAEAAMALDPDNLSAQTIAQGELTPDPIPRQRMAFSHEENQILLWTGATLKVGRRRQSNDLVVRVQPEDADNAKATKQVSGEHLVMELTAAGVNLRDMKSTNGSTLDGRSLGDLPGVLPVNQPVTLILGNTVRFQLRMFPSVARMEAQWPRGLRSRLAADDAWRHAGRLGIRSVLIEREDALAVRERYVWILRYAVAGPGDDCEIRLPSDATGGASYQMVRTKTGLWFEGLGACPLVVKEWDQFNLYKLDQGD